MGFHPVDAGSNPVRVILEWSDLLAPNFLSSAIVFLPSATDT
jgi:hypothetical protein